MTVAVGPFPGFPPAITPYGWKLIETDERESKLVPTREGYVLSDGLYATALVRIEC